MILKITPGSAIFVPSIVQAIIALGIIYNLWLINREAKNTLNQLFLTAVLVGVVSVAYSGITAFFNSPMPRFVATLLILVAMFMIGYSVMRYQMLLEKRVILQDLPLSTLTVFLLASFFTISSVAFNNSVLQMGIVTLLAILTLSLHGLVRDFLTHKKYQEEKVIRQEICSLTQNVIENASLKISLRRALAILCTNLRATKGFFAVLTGEDYHVMASLHSLPVGTILPADEAGMNERTQPKGDLAKYAVWLTPAFLGGSQVALVGIGPLERERMFTNDDLDWIEEIADQIALMVNAASIPAGEKEELGNGKEKLLTQLAIRPDKEITKSVEDCLRNLHDYIKLGKSPLASLIGVEENNHIQRGKLVQQKIIETLNILRPEGDRPVEPLPRQWWSFAILNDAYVEDVPDREIMARLYVSEGTYYRTRRKAIRGVARAIIESETLVA